MQNPTGALAPLSEGSIDQGLTLNGTTSSQQTSLNNRLNHVESRFSNSATASDEAMRINSIIRAVDNFNGWSSGESSSRARSETEVNEDGIKREDRWSSSLQDNHVIEPTNIHFPHWLDIGGSSNETANLPYHFPVSSSNHTGRSSNQNARYGVDNGSRTQYTGAFLEPNSFNSGGFGIGQPSSSRSSSDIGSSSRSSGYLLEETNDGSASSVDGWGLSCKRKALEGTPGHSSYPGGSSSSLPQAENSPWHVAPIPNASSNSSVSTPLQNSSLIITPPERLNPRLGSGQTGLASDSFPSSSVPENAGAPRNFGWRVDSGQQRESSVFNLSAPGSSRNSNNRSTHRSHGPLPFIDSVDSWSMATAASSSSVTPGQPHAMHASVLSRDMHSFQLNGSSSSRTGNPSSSRTPIAGAERQLFAHASETRNTTPNTSGWSLASNVPVGVGPSSSVPFMPSPPWIPHHNPSTNNQQRFPEFAPWSLFPSAGSSGQSGHLAPQSSGFQTSQDSAMPSGSHRRSQNQQFPRSGFVTEREGVLRMPRALRALAADIEGRNRQSDDVLGMPRSLRALAADIEGRHRLITEIRQVLHAMRRGENVQIEDYMLFDPVYQVMAEMHDRHQDMRLDVDNMSYEELLALEERIGDVSTGLNEEDILKLMNRQTYVSFTRESSENLEPCCICQEEYVDGVELGKLDCGHDYHTDCIKQWLMQKNVCPICKATALDTP